MSKNDFPVTTAIRELRAKKVEFEQFIYDYEEKGGTHQTSIVLNVEEHTVVKTLVFDADGIIIIVLQHGDKEVSTKELARLINVKKVEQCDEKRAMNNTGYQFGGTSPFGTRKPIPVYAEESIFDLERIYINGGKRGFILGINPNDIKKVFDVKFVKVAI